MTTAGQNNKPRTIGDLLDRPRLRLGGRARELTLLQRILAPDGPAVVYLHGPHGIGKTTLLEAFEDGLEERDALVARIRGGSVEPQPQAVVAAFAARLGGACRSMSELAAHAAQSGRRLVLLIDDVDEMRLVATWLRREFAPGLSAETRLLLAGRLPPPSAWTAEYGDIFAALPLGPLPRDSVVSEAMRAGLGRDVGDRIWELSQGHPLVLGMAISAARSGSISALTVGAELVDAVLAATGRPDLRRVADAAAVVRRITRPLLSAMLEEEPAPDVLREFGALPFVRLDAEGYALAEPVRRSLEGRLRAVEPDRYAALRGAAVGWINQRLGRAGPAERWRYMADLLHLVEHPTIRDAFFPPESETPPVEPATVTDFARIMSLAEARLGAAEARALEVWARHLPHRFNVARGSGGEVQGFYVFARADDRLDRIAEADPHLAYWREHLSAAPVQGEVIFMRQMLAEEEGERAPALSACMLDLKRYYLERWNLSRVYTTAGPSWLASPLLRHLGFEPLRAPEGERPGSMMLDLPGRGLIGWISTLVDMSPAGRSEPGFTFARDRREIEIEGKAVRLTKLEAGLLAALIDRAPAVVTRDDLLETVWRRAFVGSNVVDAVVRSLRDKLGPERRRIETIPKAGYRFLTEQPPV